MQCACHNFYYLLEEHEVHPCLFYTYRRHWRRYAHDLVTLRRLLTGKFMWVKVRSTQEKHLYVLPIMVSIYLFIFVCWQEVISLRIQQLRTPSWPWRSHLFLPDSEAGWSGSPPLHVIQFLANSKYTSVTTPLEKGKKGRLRTTQSFRNKPRHVSWSSYPGNCRWWP